MSEFLYGMAAGAALCLLFQSSRAISRLYGAARTVTPHFALFTTLKTMVDYACLMVEQRVRRSLLKEGDKYWLSYIINGRVYTIAVKPLRGSAAFRASPIERGYASIVNI